MKLAYRRYAVDPTPVHPGGIVFEPRAPLTLGGPSGASVYWALLDTGASHSVVPASQAAVLGVSLEGAEQLPTAGFTGDVLLLSLVTVELQISHRGHCFRWSSVVGFAPFARPEDEAVILGHAGFFDFFRVTFDGESREVELLPAANFPGSVAT